MCIRDSSYIDKRRISPGAPSDHTFGFVDCGHKLPCGPRTTLPFSTALGTTLADVCVLAAHRTHPRPLLVNQQHGHSAAIKARLTHPKLRGSDGACLFVTHEKPQNLRLFVRWCPVAVSYTHLTLPTILRV